MLAFAGNSLLCRAALRDTAIDAASFTSVRLAAGAGMLWLIVALRDRQPRVAEGQWMSAFALFAYAACFSYAYLGLAAGTGALLLFGAVQLTMIGWGLWSGQRLGRAQMLGFVVAFGGLVVLLLPGLAAPPLASAVLMLAAGAAWGVYSLRGRGTADPTRVTAGNFLRAVPMALGLSIVMAAQAAADWAGVAYAVASGALTSGLGYALWYAALRGLDATRAAVVQLGVPALAAAGGAVFLAEPIGWRLVVASAAILGGVAAVILARDRRAAR
ncbi:MAG TPA: DMT family transporter [Albitalea sp.]